MCDEPIKTAFGGVVRERRLYQGVTQAQLAKTVGLSRQTMVTIEAGKANPKLTEVLRLAVALDIDLAPFLDMAYTGR